MTRTARTSWPARAEALAQLLAPARWHPEVTAWALVRPPGDKWAVAFSGGADSLALLLLLWARWPERRARLTALHFDHRLRGAASRQDARFCREVCAGLGVPLVAGAWTGRRPSTSEAAARSARLAFFAQAMRRRRLSALWLGHQQDDIAETFFMRLARGSGAGGLAAPRPAQAGPSGHLHLRPLLDLKKAEITSALRAAGIPWREDASNAASDYFRNRVRQNVLPAWIKAAGRDALAGAACSRGLLEEDEAALEAWVDSLDALTPGGRLKLRPLAGLPRAVVRRALHRWLQVQPAPGDLSRRGFTVLLAAVERGAPVRHSLGLGFAVIRAGWLQFER